RLPNGTLLLQSAEQPVTIDPKLPCMQSVAPSGISQMYTGLSLTQIELTVHLTLGGQPGFPNGVFKEDLAQIVSGRLDDAHGGSQAIPLGPAAARPAPFPAPLHELREHR